MTLTITLALRRTEIACWYLGMADTLVRADGNSLCISRRLTLYNIRLAERAMRNAGSGGMPELKCSNWPGAD